MKAFDAKTVQRGRQLKNIEAVKKRLREIESSPKSVYYKPYKRGDLVVMRSKHKTYKGPGLQYDLVELIPIPLGDSACGNCTVVYLNLDDDYLCPECRSKI